MAPLPLKNKGLLHLDVFMLFRIVLSINPAIFSWIFPEITKETQNAEVGHAVAVHLIVLEWALDGHLRL